MSALFRMPRPPDHRRAVFRKNASVPLTALLFSAALLLHLSVPAFAEGPEPEPGVTAEPFDGYLVGVTASSGAASPGVSALEAVAEGVYWSEDLDAIAEALPASEIAFIEPNYRISLYDEEGDVSAEDASSPYADVHADFAAEYGLSGEGIRIALIDSGIDVDNANLRGANIAGGYDYVAESETISDDVAHGTYVAQVLTGRGDAGGVRGLAQNAELVSLDCFSPTGGGTIRLLAQAIRDAVDVYHCHVINMSWGIRKHSETLYEAIRYAADAGVILVAASGNVTSAYPQGTVIYPAAYEEVFAVGALDAGLNVLSISQQTEAVFVSAPGSFANFVDKSGELCEGAGTSFAAPCLSGEIALLLQLVPELDREDITGLVAQRALDMGEAGKDGAFGYGFPRMDLLLSDPWSAMKASARTENQTVSLYGWQLGTDENISVVAAYGSSGQMVRSLWLRTDQLTGSFRCSFDSGAELSCCKVFFLSSDCMPHVGCNVHSVPAEAEPAAPE